MKVTRKNMKCADFQGDEHKKEMLAVQDSMDVLSSVATSSRLNPAILMQPKATADAFMRPSIIRYFIE